MADFDDNPFADPSAINPFADPSVQKGGATDVPPVDDYNPFAEEAAKEKEEPVPPKLPPPPTKPVQEKPKKQKEKKSPVQPKAKPQPTEPPPALLPTEPPPTYEPAPQQFGGREDELRKREEEISKRESQLQEREKNLNKLGVDARPRNFPPLPKFCPCQPCFYLNIGEEIPPTERWKVRILVGMLFMYTLLLFLNLVFSIPGPVVVGQATSKNQNNIPYTTVNAIVTLVLGILWLFLLPLAALFCWFMPAYYAYRKDSSLAFMWFFFIMVIQCAVWVVFALGPPNFSIGIISGASVVSVNKVVGALWITVGFLWLLMIPWACVMIFLVHRYYRLSGGTLDKAAAEAARGAAGNKYVRDAAKGAVRAGVSAATSSE